MSAFTSSNAIDIRGNIFICTGIDLNIIFNQTANYLEIQSQCQGVSNAVSA